MLTEIIDCLQNYKYVSFDVFDTLLLRTVSEPIQVYDLVEYVYNKRHKCGVSNYKKIRRDAERIARDEHRGHEITIKQIEEKLPYPEDVCRELINIEKKCEIQNCIPNQEMIDVLNWCRDHDKIIIIISDMYLDRATFNELFLKIGVTYHYLFISSEETVTKRSGALFNVVLKKMEIRSHDLIHIGDDYNNDFVMPQKYGIRAIQYKFKDSNLVSPYLPKIKKKSIEKEQNIRLISLGFRNIKSDCPVVRIGYFVLGPLLVDFCNWLHEQKEKSHLQKLFFVAREGYLIYNCYCELFPSERDTIEYIYLNRNLLRLPLLPSTDLSNYILDTIGNQKEQTWDDILSMFLAKDIKTFKDALKLRFPYINITEPLKKTDLKTGKYEECLKEIANKQKQIIRIQTLLLLTYLDNKGFFEKRIGLVNNSINGTGQYLIESFIKKYNKTTTVLGLQFVKNRKCVDRLDKRCKAWVTDSGYSLFISEIIRSNCYVLEHLMFESGGSAKCFKKEGDAVMLEKEDPKDERYNFNTVESIQKYAMLFVKHYAENLRLPLNYCGLDAFLNLIQFPLYEDANLLGNLYEENQRLADTGIAFNNSYIENRNIPNQILWREGYLTLKHVSKKDIKKYIKCKRSDYYKTYIKRYIQSFLMNTFHR